MGYDEQSSINYIRHSTGDLLAAYDDDQILNIIDMVWDWQDANGFLDIDAGADAPEINVADVVAYCRRMLGRDSGNRVATEHIEPIVVAELEFEDSIDEF